VIFVIFRMATAAVSEFQKFEGQYVSPYKFCQKRSNIVDIWQFNSFQNDGRPPSWICRMLIRTTHDEHLVVFSVVQNLV